MKRPELNARKTEEGYTCSPCFSRTVCLALATAQSPVMWHNLQAIRMTELSIFYLSGTKKLELLECVWWVLDMVSHASNSKTCKAETEELSQVQG